MPSNALTWSSQNGGVASEASYPYISGNGQSEQCRTNIGKLTHNTGYKSISTDEDQIAQALVTYGPLSIAVDATPFQSYNGGVMNNPSCSQTNLDHAINLVGYGSTTVQYWKIRNSWGTVWGEAGYIRLVRGDCACGVCTAVVTATGVSISDSPTPPGPPAPPGPSPTPPGPSPTPPGPSPTPPGPTPCMTCEYNGQCPSGQACYFPSEYASSGCCYPYSPYYDYDSDYAELTNLTVVV